MITKYIPAQDSQQKILEPGLVYCVNCDEKVAFTTREAEDGCYEAHCEKCGEELYIPELNDFNVRLRNIQRMKHE